MIQRSSIEQSLSIISSVKEFAYQSAERMHLLPVVTDNLPHTRSTTPEVSELPAESESNPLPTTPASHKTLVPTDPNPTTQRPSNVPSRRPKRVCDDEPQSAHRKKRLRPAKPPSTPGSPKDTSEPVEPPHQLSTLQIPVSLLRNRVFILEDAEYRVD